MYIPKLKFICIFSIIAYYYLFIFCIFIKKIPLPIIYLTIFIGLVSYILLRNLTKLMFWRYSFFLILKWLFTCTYGLETNYLISIKHPNLYSSSIYILILFYFALDLIRIYVTNNLKENFVSSYRLKWYKDIITLERLFLYIKTGNNIKDDIEIIDHIQNRKKRINPKYIFCMLSDDVDTKKNSINFEILDIINYNIENDQMSFLLSNDNENIINNNNDLSGDENDKINNDIKDCNLNNYEKIQKDLTGISQIIDDEKNKKKYNNKTVLKELENNKVQNIDNKNYILLKYLTQEDFKCLMCKNDFINVIKCEEKGCLKITVKDFNKLKKIEKKKLQGKITLESLSKILSKKEAKMYFRILTQNFESFLTFTDFEECMRQFNNMRSNLISTLNNNKVTMKQLFRALKCVQSVVFSIFFLYIFKADKFVKYIVTPIFISVFPILWNIFNSFMYIIYSQSYDIGDRVYIGNDNLVVKDIGLTSTTFERWNNENVIISNRFINEKAITNIRRSKNQQWNVHFYILNDTSEITLKKLKKNIKAFVNENPAFSHVCIIFDEIKDSRYLKISFTIKHTINHQNGFFMWKVQNKFMIKLVKELNANSIEYLEPQITWICNNKNFNDIF